MPLNSYVPGQWSIICDVCGFKFKASQIRKRWDDLLVCEKDFERDHPQKNLRVQEDGQAVPYIRDEPADIIEYICYLYGSLAFSDLGEADCMRADIAVPSYLSALQLRGPEIITDYSDGDTLMLDDMYIMLYDDFVDFYS